MMADLEELRRDIDTIDREMALLFARRMDTVEQIADYKQEHDQPIYCPEREEEILEKRCRELPMGCAAEEYRCFQRQVMALSRGRQKRLIGADTPADILYCRTRGGEYPIVVCDGLLDDAARWIGEGGKRRICVVTDDGVPDEYVRRLQSVCKVDCLVKLAHGESSKSFENLERICREMLRHGFDRRDCVVGLGGGVIGDIAGLAAATYMRGIGYYAVPTTLLAQVDASVGGKTALDLDGVKNAVGAFYPPRAVLIDPTLTATLPPRQIANGMAEVIKIAAVADAGLFRLLEEGIGTDRRIELIRRAVSDKIAIVEEDETDIGRRRILNFGHTLGHGIESARPDFLHGECVALGMLPMCAPSVRVRLKKLLNAYGLPTDAAYDLTAAFDAVRHDKKMDHDILDTVYVPAIGKAEIRPLTVGECCQLWTQR